MLLTVLWHKAHMICPILSFYQHDVAIESSVRTHRCADISNYKLQQGFYSILGVCGDSLIFLLKVVVLGVVLEEGVYCNVLYYS